MVGLLDEQRKARFPDVAGATEPTEDLGAKGTQRERVDATHRAGVAGHALELGQERLERVGRAGPKRRACVTLDHQRARDALARASERGGLEDRTRVCAAAQPNEQSSAPEPCVRRDGAGQGRRALVERRRVNAQRLGEPPPTLEEATPQVSMGRRWREPFEERERLGVRVARHERRKLTQRTRLTRR